MSSGAPPVGVVLAAGQGTRMKSDKPKVLHPVCGLSMVEWVVRALTEAKIKRIIVVVGFGGGEVRKQLEGYNVELVDQEERLGTGHAVMCAAPLLAGHGGVTVVSAGDTPLLRSETVCALIESTGAGAVAALATATMDDPGAYGRILRGPDGRFQAIVEAKDCTPDQLETKEWNPALYAFSNPTLLQALPRLKADNKQGEYYLTDVLGILRESGGEVVTVGGESEQFFGVNDRWQLAEAGAAMRRRILRRHAENGVTILDPDSTTVGPDVVIGVDTLIHPNTVIEGKSRIGKASEVGPNTWVKDCFLGDGVRAYMSHLERAEMGDGSRCGPFANLRPGAALSARVKVGNFVEIKNANIGEDTSVSHLTYIGDARVGHRTNIGAGTITCNFDGFVKSQTTIGDDVFVGSNTTLIAPVTIGDESMVAAGSVVTYDVPEGSMAIGRGRQENKGGWYRRWRAARMKGDQ